VAVIGGSLPGFKSNRVSKFLPNTNIYVHLTCITYIIRSYN